VKHVIINFSLHASTTVLPCDMCGGLVTLRLEGRLQPPVSAAMC